MVRKRKMAGRMCEARLRSKRRDGGALLEKNLGHQEPGQDENRTTPKRRRSIPGTGVECATSTIENGKAASHRGDRCAAWPCAQSRRSFYELAGPDSPAWKRPSTALTRLLTVPSNRVVVARLSAMNAAWFVLSLFRLRAALGKCEARHRYVIVGNLGQRAEVRCRQAMS